MCVNKRVHFLVARRKLVECFKDNLFLIRSYTSSVYVLHYTSFDRISGWTKHVNETMLLAGFETKCNMIIFRMFDWMVCMTVSASHDNDTPVDKWYIFIWKPNSVCICCKLYSAVKWLIKCCRVSCCLKRLWTMQQSGFVLPKGDHCGIFIARN